MKMKLLTGVSVVSSLLLADSRHHQEESSESTMNSGGMVTMDMSK